MLILLPPSEGKAAPSRRGRPTRTETLTFPELTATREAIREALIRASAGADALEVLGVSPGLAAEVARNRDLADLPARPAMEIYTGVLYDALDFAGLSPTGRRRAARSLLVQSALWGPVGPRDRIAPYRLSMGTTLPGIGPLARAWRAVLDPVLSEAVGTGVLVDCRSSTYAAAWQPPVDVARRCVAVRVFTEEAGRRTVVSHQAKHTRGLVARWLLESPSLPKRPEHVAAVVAAHARCVLVDLGRKGHVLDVIQPPLRQAQGA